ncbi:hypothetical protein GCM10022217_27390 [Chryseobacterium ginsenosidimutans]
MFNYVRSKLWTEFLFEKSKKRTVQVRYVYLRVTVDGVPKETSTKMKWDARRWDQEAGRAGDARTLNFYLEALITKNVYS